MTRFTTLLLSTLLVGTALAQPDSVQYRSQTVCGAYTHVIQADLADPSVKVSVELAQGFPGTDESFDSMIERSGAVAAIDGTFFSLDNKYPIGDIVVDGALQHQGMMGTALAIAPDNSASFGRVTWGHAADWSGYDTVLACGPTLVSQGRIDLQAEAEGFRDPHVLGLASRSAVGRTADNQLLLVSIPDSVTLQTLASTMQELGCVQAMNLDGGASTAMYYRGSVVLSPSRPLTNLLVIYQNRVEVRSRPARQKAAPRPRDNGTMTARVQARTSNQVHRARAVAADQTAPFCILGVSLIVVVVCVGLVSSSS